MPFNLGIGVGLGSVPMNRQVVPVVVTTDDRITGDSDKRVTGDSEQRIVVEE